MASELFAWMSAYCDENNDFGNTSARKLSNVLTNKPNILDLTKADFFQLNLSQIHGKIG